MRDLEARMDGAQFQRLRARRGAKKAIIAVAASMLTTAYYILRDGVPYKDLGPEHFTRRNKDHAAKRLKEAPRRSWFYSRSPPRGGWSFNPGPSDIKNLMHCNTKQLLVLLENNNRIPPFLLWIVSKN